MQLRITFRAQESLDSYDVVIITLIKIILNLYLSVVQYSLQDAFKCNLILSSQYYGKTGRTGTMIPSLQMRKLRPRKVN